MLLLAISAYAIDRNTKLLKLRQVIAKRACLNRAARRVIFWIEIKHHPLPFFIRQFVHDTVFIRKVEGRGLRADFEHIRTSYHGQLTLPSLGERTTEVLKPKSLPSQQVRGGTKGGALDQKVFYTATEDDTDTHEGFDGWILVGTRFKLDDGVVVHLGFL